MARTPKTTVTRSKATNKKRKKSEDNVSRKKPKRSSRLSSAKILEEFDIALEGKKRTSLPVVKTEKDHRVVTPTPENKYIEIFIMKKDTPTTSILVLRNGTVDDIMIHIQSMLKIPIDKQLLKFKDKVLKKEDALITHDIKDGSAIHVHECIEILDFIEPPPSIIHPNLLNNSISSIPSIPLPTPMPVHRVIPNSLEISDRSKAPDAFHKMVTEIAAMRFGCSIM